MKLLRKLENNLFTAITVYLISVLGFAITSFLLTSNYKDIPLGFLFSGMVIGTLYLITHFLNKLDERSGKSLWSFVAIISRFVIIVTVMIIIGLMNYRWNNVLFNIFVFVGVYTFGTITFALLHLLNKERKESNA